jgi:rare lipoprotein A
MVADSPVKIGKPYRVAGITYTPSDDRSYDQTGLASWYGPGQGRTTANGERFDPRRVGAAHKTLPLPSYVEVTALGTGRRIIVRVNDRGPFVADRIIDLSYAAAQLLGIARSGVSRVRVRRVFPDDSTRRALRSGRPAAALPSVRADAGVATLARVAASGYQSPDLPAERISDPQ